MVGVEKLKDKKKDVNSESISSNIPEEMKKVKKLVKSKITCCLPCNENNIIEDYDYNPPKDFFPDNIDPRRVRFDCKLDYNRDSETLVFKDLNTRKRYRNQQISTQMHFCCITCWKYNKMMGDKTCRFHFPYINCIEQKDTIIKIDKDKRGRKRVRALPPRNNGILNNTYVDPLLFLAHGGNVDCQYIDNEFGACEYTAAYTAKSDEPDEKKLKIYFLRKLVQMLKYNTDYNLTDRDCLLAVGDAIQGSTQIGSIQACTYLLKEKFVKSSIKVININTLPYHKIDQVVSRKNNKTNNKNNNENESVLYTGPKSQIGRRIAYSEICDEQINKFEKCLLTLYSLLTSYDIHSHSEYSEKILNKITHINEYEEMITISKTDGLIISPKELKRFKTNNFVFTKYRKNVVINLRPSIKVDYNNELFIYSTLILHCPFPFGGEKEMLKIDETAFEKFNELKIKNMIPEYLEKTHSIIKESEQLLENHGTEDIINENITNYNNYNNYDEENHNDNCCDMVDDIINNDNIIDNNDDDENNNNNNNNNKSNFSVIYDKNIEKNVNNNNFYKTVSNKNIRKYKSSIDKYIEENKIFRKDQVQINENNNNNNESNLNLNSSNNNNNNNNNDVADKQNRLNLVNNRITQLKNNPKAKYQFDVISKYQKYLKNNPFGVNYTKDKQIIGFTSGEGGTGKSEIIKVLTEYTIVTYGKTLGMYGRTLNLTPSGASGIYILIVLYYYILAFIIDGSTWQSALNQAIMEAFKDCSDNTIKSIAKKIDGIILLIIDEISMIGTLSLYNIENKIRRGLFYNYSKIINCNPKILNNISTLPFGGIHVLFSGTVNI